MSLTWGHASREPAPRRIPVVASVAIVALVAVFLADAPPPRAVIGPADIQPTFDRREAALAARDIDALRSLYDPRRGSFTACALERARIAFPTPGRPPHYRVTRTVAYRGYVRAYAQAPGGTARLHLRLTPSGWVFTEPTADELGEERRIEGDGVRLSYWSIDEELAAPVMRAAEYARAYALPLAPVTGAPTMLARLLPTREAASSMSCAADASAYLTQELFEIRLLGERLLFTSDALGDVTPSVRAVFVHETLHWTQGLAAPRSIGKANWWLIEGWPTLVAEGEARLARDLPRIGCGDLPTYAQLASGTGLVRDPPPDVIVRYYTYASSAVRYLTGSFGGDDAYWRTLRSYEGPGTPDEIMQRSITTTADGFRDGWAAWVKERYCS
jgi:hypothetical protein